MTAATSQRRSQHVAGFSLVELLVAMAILSVLLLFLMAALAAVSSFYIKSHDLIRSEEKGRAVIELISREVSPAVIDTRMQFAILPGFQIADIGAPNVVDTSPAMLWMAPLGPGGDLRSVGYFLSSDQENKKYRLKRIFVKDDNPNGYFPKLGDARDTENRTDAKNAEWFTRNWDPDAFDDVSDANDRVIISTVSDGVVAFWIRALDPMGNPIPHLSSSKVHPESSLLFNSAAYFYMADGDSFDDDSTFVYLKQNLLTMKANRLPAALELAIVMISEDNLSRGSEVPVQRNVLTNDDQILDLDASLRNYTELLEAAGFNAPRVFRTTVKLTNGG